MPPLPHPPTRTPKGGQGQVSQQESPNAEMSFGLSAGCLNGQPPFFFKKKKKIDFMF